MNLKNSCLLLLALLLYSTGQAQDIGSIDFKRPIQLSGTVNLQFEHYSSSGIDNRRKPTSWMLSGMPTLTVLGVAMPFSILLSNFENRYYQPFNQYGISPKYKWVTVHAGYRSIQFSPYTLAGYRMLGGGVELNPGKLRLGFMYGRLNRSEAIDSAQLANPLAFRTMPSYTRMAYAGKIGFGTDKSYFDISYLKGWDKAQSLDASLRDSVAPAENHVLGLSWKLTLLKKLTWQTDIGLSHYTNDIYADPLLLDSTDPKVLRDLTDFLGTRISSQLLTAGETKLSYTGSWYGLGVSYKRVDPDYQSMGAYFFQTDIQQLSLLPSLRLLKGKLMISGNLGWQEDNLYRQKLATSKRFTGNGNINYQVSQVFGFNFNYSNFGISQNPLRTSPTDELFKQVSQSYVLMPHLNFVNEHSVKSLQLVGSLQSLNSPRQSINTAPDQHTLFGSLVYSHTWLSQQLSVNASANYNSTNLPAGDIGSYGAGLGASAPLFKQRLQVNANATYNSNTFNGSNNGYTLNADIGMRVKLVKQHSLQLSFNYLKNDSEDQTAIQSFHETTLRIGYGITF